MLSVAARFCGITFRPTNVSALFPVRQIPTFSVVNSVGWNNTIDFHQYRYRSNRSRRGLYDGKDIRSGNNVSFSMRATKRKFKPNVFLKRVYSETLDEMVRFHLTTSALRSIDKAGGLDSYLMTSKHVTSGEGLEVKKRIIRRRKVEAKLTTSEAD
jgi:large subunit ribosomal protein L28